MPVKKTGHSWLRTRLICLLLALTMLPLFTLSAVAQEEITNLFGSRLLDQPTIFSEYDSVQGMARQGDTLFIRTTNRLYTFGPGDKEAVFRTLMPNYSHRPRSLEGADKPGAPYVKNIISDGETLYGIDYEAQLLYTLALEGDKLTYTNPLALDLSTFVSGEAPQIYYQDPSWALTFGGRLYLRSQNWDEAESDLISFDLKTGEKQEHQVAYLQAAAPYKDGRLIAMRYNPNDNWDPETNSIKKPEIVVFNPQDDTLEVVGAFSQFTGESDELMSIHFEVTDDALYLYTDTDLYRYDAPFTQGRLIGYLPMFSLFTSPIKGGIQALPDGRLAVGFYQNIFVRERTEKGLEGYVPLTIGGGLDLWDGQAIMRVLMKLDKVVLRRSDVGWVNAEKLASMFLTNQVAVDIMPLNVYGFDLGKLIDKGYLLDMQDNPGIKGFVSAFAPNLTTAYVREGAIYAAPATLVVAPVSYKVEAFKATKLPVPTSFPELIDLVETWVNGASAQHPDFRLVSDSNNLKEWLRRLFIDTYINYRLGAGEELVFDTPLFRETLARLEAIDYGDFGMAEKWDDPSFRALMEELRDKQPLIESNAGFEPQYMTGINNQGERRKLPLSLPLEPGGPYYKDTDFTMLAVLSTTKYPEEAQRFVEAFLSGLDPIFSMTLNLEEPRDVPNPHYEESLVYLRKELDQAQAAYDAAEGAEKSNLEQTLIYSRKNYEDNIEGLRYLATKEDLTLIHAMVRELYLMDGLGASQRQAFQEDSQLLQQYFDGAISLDQFIKTLDDKMRLVRMEHQ